MLFNDIFVVVIYGKGRYPSTKIYPITSDMNVIVDKTDSRMLTISSGFGWELHQFQFTQENSSKLWFNSFQKAKEYVKRRDKRLSTMNSCPTLLVESTIQKLKQTEQLGYLQVSD